MIWLFVLLGLIVSPLVPLLFKLGGNKTGYFIALIPLAVFVYFFSLIPVISAGEIITEKHHWIPAFGIGLNFLLDGLSLLFALMISGIGTLVFLYSGSYMYSEEYKVRFFSFLLIFMTAMLGVVLSDDLIALFLFWELTSLTSFFLIGYKSNSEKSQYAALQALLVTGLGGMFLFGAFIYIEYYTGTFTISEILSTGFDLRGSHLYPWLLAFLFLGAFTKSAQVPFHFWLPNAMEAPTPVSAYLHSATMVKAGVYLVARFNPILGEHIYWNNTLLIFGATTMIIGAFLSLYQVDMKRILAYSTLSALGILMFTLSFGNEGIIAAVLFLFIHSLYKGSLFLLAGAVDHSAGSRNITQLGGLMKPLPLLGIIAMMGVLAHAGLPPFLAFIGKEELYSAAVSRSEIMYLSIGLIIMTKIMLFASGFQAGWKPFSGNRILLPEGQEIHKPSWFLMIPPLLLGSLGLLFGIFPGLIGTSLIDPAASAISGTIMKSSLGLWHGYSWLIPATLVTYGLGYLLFRAKLYLQKDSAFFKQAERAFSSWIYDLKLKAFDLASYKITKLLQNGYLRFYLITILLVMILGLGSTMILKGPFESVRMNFEGARFYEFIVAGLIGIGTLGAILATARLSAVAALGVVGFGVSLLFILFGAPDIALTQFTIDTLSVLLFVLVLYRLPRFFNFSSKAVHIRDIIISIVSGAMITLLILFVLNETKQSKVSQYYASNSYILAKGKNVVNVILVDFRGADTLVEITVLAIAAIGVYSLLKLKSKEDEL